MHELATLGDTHNLAKIIASSLKPRDCLTLTGTLGAGKTTFMQYVLKELGYEGKVTSPTFVLVQEYPVYLPDNQATILYHMDAYRLEQASECHEIGLPEMLNSGILCIEWPEICADWLPKDRINLTITIEGGRRFAIVETSNRELPL